MDKRVKRFSLIDVKIGPGCSNVFGSDHSQTNTRYNGFKHLVVRGICNTMYNQTILRVLV
jgi:hypothetical protein